MDYIFYDTSNKLVAAQILEQTEHHFHAKGTGSSVLKIKSKDVLLKGAVALPNAAAVAEQIDLKLLEIDLDFVWECAPADVFSFEFLAQEFFGAGASLIEKGAMWQALQSAPIYFAKKGKGQYVKQPQEQIQIALAAVAKKEERLKLQAQWVQELLDGNCPAEILQARDAILRRQNPNDLSFKAVQAAAEHMNVSQPQLLLHAGAFKNAFDLHRSLFVAEHYPQGIAAQLPAPVLDVDDLPFNEAVQLFSIDDSYTTEIDDAFSVQDLGGNQYRIGVHIATPSLAVTRDDAADKHASTRMSTMYTPGEKITMLPDDWVASFSLDEGTIKPVVSLYVTFDAQSETVFADITSVVERVKIAHNLRHDIPSMQLSAEDLTNELADVPCARAMKTLWLGAQHLSAARDAMRGRPENNNRADFSFVIDAQNQPLHGDESVTIVQRPRGSAVDKIVSEWMIFANVQWATLLSDLKVAALFRTQSNMGVRTSTHSQPHMAMGVPAYMWSTSPLRRYTDWFNQIQLLAAIKDGVAAPMTAPFKLREVDVLTRMGNFDEKYKAYNEQQNKMEKYWCLQWVNQHLNEHGFLETNAILIKEGMLRLKELPLYVPCVSVPAETPLQSTVVVRLSRVDLAQLTVDVALVSVMAAEAELA